MKCVLVFFLLALSASFHVSARLLYEADVEDPGSRNKKMHAAIDQMSIKKLQKELAERGAECSKCETREHYQIRLKDVWDVARTTTKQQPSDRDGDGPNPTGRNPHRPQGSARVIKDGTPEMEELLKSLRKDPSWKQQEDAKFILEKEAQYEEI